MFFFSCDTETQAQVGPGVPVIPLRDELARDMKDYMPDDAVSLVHGDYKFDNILLHEKEPRVVSRCGGWCGNNTRQ